jgi:hypothetical protein
LLPDFINYAIKKYKRGETMTETAGAKPNLDDRRTRLKFKLDETRQELLTVLQSLTPEQMELPTRNPGWNVQQIAIHVSQAEGSMEPIALRILEQDPKQREIAQNVDLARYNASMIKRRLDKTIPELIEELNTSRAHMLAILENASEAELDLPGYHPAAGEIILYGLFVIIYRHEREHIEDIKLALAAAH